MATLDSLKQALRQQVKTSSLKQPLSAMQYRAGFDILVRGPGWTTYQDFIIPQLSELMAPLFHSLTNISALEIGPGPMSILGYLPSCLRQKIRKYTAFESNDLFAERLEEWLRSTSETESPLLCLDNPPKIYRMPFVLNENMESSSSSATKDHNEKYNIILFCHSMYGMKPKHRFIEQALEMLVEQPQGAIVVVFHRDGTLHVEGLVCHRTAVFPTGIVSVSNEDDVLDSFSSFVAGFTMQEVEEDRSVRDDWRKVCRALGHREEVCPDHLVFGSPNVMVAFARHATMLPELTAQVPLMTEYKMLKSWEACLHPATSIVRPTNIGQIQYCVQWALKHEVALTVISGGHSGHCVWPNVVSVDMRAFNQVHILTAGNDREVASNFGSLIVAESGCKTGDIVHKTMKQGLTVPLGARPSVGAGLWLQGGIGHLSRLHGLACDAIVGAVVVNVNTSQVVCVGIVPKQHWPVGATRSDSEADLLWALRGAGTGFGIVVSVTFRAYTAAIFSVRNWVIPLRDGVEGHLWLQKFDTLVAKELPRNCSADAYLYWNTDQLHLGVIVFESSTTRSICEITRPTVLSSVLGPEHSFKVVDAIGLFETELYMSGMHGGHGGGKTSSFKRCIFLKCIGAKSVTDILLRAIETRPSSLCYLHLLQGGGAVGDVAANATAFGCRDWEFACVVTGVWPRDQDRTDVAQSVVQWVYKVAKDLLSLSSGVYGADLGPDPRDAALAVKAYGPNRSRLARLKHNLDPQNMLSYTWRLPKGPMEQKIIILVTGEICVGKDYLANLWVSLLIRDKNLTACAVSISDATKREYAAVTGADFKRLLCDRDYKEQHRLALTTFFQEQVWQRPQLREEQFMNVVNGAVDVQVLLITGMRDDAPVATFSHLVPDSRLLEVQVQASEQTRRTRRGRHSGDSGCNANNDSDYLPSLIFNNDTIGKEAAKSFAEHHLLPLIHEDLQRLASMVHRVEDFPRLGIEFHHVLGISREPGGLTLCTNLLQSHFTGDWAGVSAVVCCEAGGFVFASALALRVDVPLVLIREAGKLPPPTIAVDRPSSYISSLASNNSENKRIEMERDAIPRGASVVVVDDVLSTGKTLCAVLQLLVKAGVNAEDISVMVVAEFPVHRGRQQLRQSKFGRIKIQSLLVLGGT